jgi:hypothetical protein
VQLKLACRYVETQEDSLPTGMAFVNYSKYFLKPSKPSAVVATVRRTNSNIKKRNLRSPHTVHLCVCKGSQKKTVIISLYSINLMVFYKQKGVCFLRCMVGIFK